MVFGQSQKHRRLKGNVLFSTLALFLLCLFLMQGFLESYRLKIDSYLRIKKYYQAKIIKQMFMMESNQLEEQGKGEYDYNVGTVQYTVKQDLVELVITVSPFQFEFTERVIDTDNTTD
ncbi:competence type IV pilus minor pilin ComGG [Enterococcus mundtii]|uniref:Competence protein ComGG n=1 Tax=Enterococcus mundtii TaxID=53346 RepID=A0A2S7RQW4_ENTMU|nr:competence type IV pilus minor pilin ComGG [Enterococcus mundtii]PQF22004.1 hypothetical protein CUS89_12110 [Enterococcus mundtii]PTO38682.1 hypothetical protein C6P52_08130 [Enterococcus mundtii]PTO43974.1 hypothetical protein C6P54_07390 [Enterococcus mundtii]